MFRVLPKIDYRLIRPDLLDSVEGYGEGELPELLEAGEGFVSGIIRTDLYVVGFLYCVFLQRDLYVLGYGKEKSLKKSLPALGSVRDYLLGVKSGGRVRNVHVFPEDLVKFMRRRGDKERISVCL